MSEDISNGIKSFIKNSLNQYYKRFQVKLDNYPTKDSNKSAIKITNDGSVYVYNVGNYTGTTLDDSSTLQDIIKNSSDKVAELNTSVNSLNTSVSTLNTSVNSLNTKVNKLNTSVGTLNSITTDLAIDVDELKANILNVSINIKAGNNDNIIIESINVDTDNINWKLTDYSGMFYEIENNPELANTNLTNIYGIIHPVYITINDVDNNEIAILKQYGSMRTHVVEADGILTYIRDITCKGFCSFDENNNQIIEHCFKFSIELETSFAEDMFNNFGDWTVSIYDTYIAANPILAI